MEQCNLSHRKLMAYGQGKDGEQESVRDDGATNEQQARNRLAKVCEDCEGSLRNHEITL